jgi:hypothetical protein
MRDMRNDVRAWAAATRVGGGKPSDQRPQQQHGEHWQSQPQFGQVMVLHLLSWGT